MRVLNISITYLILIYIYIKCSSILLIKMFLYLLYIFLGHVSDANKFIAIHLSKKKKKNR